MRGDVCDRGNKSIRGAPTGVRVLVYDTLYRCEMDSIRILRKALRTKYSGYVQVKLRSWSTWLEYFTSDLYLRAT